MLENVRISVERDSERQDVCTLVLTSASGQQWRKRYHGNLFLLFDAEELGLIVEESTVHMGKPKKSLSKAATVDTNKLDRLRFTGPNAIS